MARRGVAWHRHRRKRPRPSPDAVGGWWWLLVAIPAALRQPPGPRLRPSLRWAGRVCTGPSLPLGHDWHPATGPQATLPPCCPSQEGAPDVTCTAASAGDAAASLSAPPPSVPLGHACGIGEIGTLERPRALLGARAELALSVHKERGKDRGHRTKTHLRDANTALLKAQENAPPRQLLTVDGERL